VNTQIKLAIIAIGIIIPLTSIVISQTSSHIQYTVFENSKLQVVSSSNFLHEFSQIIGKEKIDSTLLIPEGVDPHNWEPTVKETERLQSSDLVIINGIGYEHWIDSLDSSTYRGIIVDTSNGILDNHDDSHDDSDLHSNLDPHIWLNPVYAKSQVQNIANAFSNSDPANEKYYQSNAIAYIKELELLDSKIQNDLSGCKTNFITFHNAFSYFAEKYNLTQHTIISSNDSHGEVTLKTLENVIITAKKFNIKIIFAEESIDTRTSQVIADEIGGKVLVLSPLEIISNENYISKMIQNLENLKEALC
tara:strand:+ start:52 stop:966 length:915 start_codon:yes stop_codon:yes gene_type:complete